MQSRAPRLIESWFPFVDVSRLVEADRRSRDGVYGIHKWFARRPPTLVRALLLASHLESDELPAAFWEKHQTASSWLEGAVVFDPFMGGGTSLVESARMGASVIGRDVDPIAVKVVESELAGPSVDFETASTVLAESLTTQFEDLFTGVDKEWTPLHWFWLSKVTCPDCQVGGLLYKDLILATSSGRHGSVVRDSAMHVFCPTCLKVHAIGSGRTVLACCGKRHRIASGTFARGRYHCSSCGKSSTHEDLQSGRAPRAMVAVEETKPREHRRIRAATDLDRDLVDRAAAAAATVGDEFDSVLSVDRRDRRPVSAGYTSVRSLFSPRQWLVFSSAFSTVREGSHSADLERELTLMLTGALASNNLLCGYARDWGRLAPLFSVRGFSLPALTVELNLFHPTAGRGTLRSARSRISERAETPVRRARLEKSAIERMTIELPVIPKSVDIECRSASDSSGQTTPLANVCVTDPPYFDYIAYSELSEFFRVWLREPALAGLPLLPDSESPVDSFAWGLAKALTVTLERLQPSTPLVFTYHSANVDAWTAIGLAFDKAKLNVVALWPVLADPHMGHHTAEGNCEWDIVLVVRRSSEVSRVELDAAENRPIEWLTAIESEHFSVGPGDRSSFNFAWAMSRTRLGRALESVDEIRSAS